MAARATWTRPFPAGALRAAAFVAVGFLAPGCGSSAASTADGGHGGGDAGDTPGGSGDGASDVGGACEPDRLDTGLVAMQTGISVDAFDCAVMKSSVEYAEPDPMLFKAVIYAESRFDQFSVGCTNKPCGTPSGWSASETGCYGLMQVVPACNPKPSDPWILPNGHPNLTKDPASPDWPTSVFNPDMNVNMGVGGLADNRAQVKKQFPGCTEDQYTLMALGNYANYGSTKGCTTYNTSYIDSILPTYREYAAAAKYPAHPY